MTHVIGLLNKYTKDIYGSIVYTWNRNSSSDDKRENCFDLGQCNVRAKRNQLDARQNLREQLKVGNGRIWFPQAVL